jgi:hypoxia up-regulated 1
LKDLKAIVNPALKRMKESSTRPARVQLLQDMLKNAESMKQLIESQIANDEQTYSSSLSASSTSTAEESETSTEATPAPSASDDTLDDLDDDSYSTSTSSSKTSTKSSAAAKPTGPTYTLFTPTDLASLTTIYESTKPWLETQLELQEKLTESDDPALTVLEIDSRLREFERVLNRMYERMTAAAGREAKKNSGKQNKKKTTEEKGKGKEKAKEEKKKAKEDTKDEL